MPVLQLVERPEHSGYVLDVVEAPTGPVAPLGVEALPMSAGSRELLNLAAAAPTLGLYAVRVQVADLSGRPTGPEVDELEEELLALARSGLADLAARALSQTPNLHVDRIALEDPETHATVTCSRHGMISIQGPAVEQRDSFVTALLVGFERAFSR
jgi:hypothetical protein